MSSLQAANPAGGKDSNKSPANTSASSLPRSKATLPHPAGEWDRHRETITRLYYELDLPMRDVQQIMETEHGFKATKRMYVTRLKQWNICKNYKAKDKEALAATILKAHSENRSLTDITFNNKPVKLDRVLRHARTVARAQQARTRIDNSESTSSEHDDFRSSLDASGNSISPILTDDGSDSSDSVRGRKERIASARASSRLSIAQRNPPSSPTWDYFGRPQNSPSLELILNQTRIYFDSRFEPNNTTYILSHPSSNNDSISTAIIHDSIPELALTFWTNIKSGIYFLDTGSPARSWPLFNSACQCAGDVLALDPINFFREIYATFSPCNTKIHSDVRIMLVRYLRQMSLFRLGSNHPITVVLGELLLDDGERETSETPLKLLLSLYTRYLGPSHFETFQLQRSLLNLYRSDHDLFAAERIAKSLVKACEDTHGTHEEQTLMSLSELGHVYAVQGRYDEAIIQSETVIERYKEAQKEDYPSNRAAYALEGIAEVYKHKGNSEKYVYWLEQALAGAWKARGGSAATMHVRDKLENVLIEHNREAEAMALRIQYPEQIATMA